MRRTRTFAAGLLVAVAILAGCAGDDPSTSPTTTGGSGATTSTTPAATTTAAANTGTSPDAIRNALLTQSDIQGATVSTSSQEDFDLSTCFPGNPLGAKTDPSEVKAQGLELAEGTVERQYGSKARRATPAQAKEFVSTFASPAGSACVVNAFKKRITDDPNPPKVDASGLAGTATTVAVGDGGAQLSIAGNLTGQGEVVAVAADLLIFQKGSTVVFISVGTVRATTAPGQALELARKVAGRLP